MRNILFLCTGNSARSIMAEAYMNKAGAGGWRAFSAGSKPTGAPNPFALQTLRNHDIPLGPEPLHSKSWDEFANGDAPIMDVIVTVCDNAAGETCPIWPAKDGRRARNLHWSFPDPAAAKGEEEEKRTAFETVFASIRTHIDKFLRENAA
ncbi:MAG: arsenate reductase ArsC [Pseudomonadota bacterium]